MSRPIEAAAAPRAGVLAPPLAAPRVSALRPARANGGARTLLSPNPFDLGAVRALALPEGLTIAEMVDAAALDPVLEALAVVRVGGREVPRELWGRVRPLSHSVVEVAVRPAGGDEGAGKVLRTVLQIAVFAVSVWVGGAVGGGILGAVAAGVTNVAGNLLINALVPPATLETEEREQRFSVDGAANQARPWGAAPLVLGRHRAFPPLLGQPLKEIVGDDVYLRYLLAWGPAPIALSELKIGETALDEFEGVEVQHHLAADDPPITLYSEDHHQESVGALLEAETAPGGWTTRTTQSGADQTTVILAWPQGLGGTNDKGKSVSASVTVEIQYRPTGGSDAWVSARPNATASDAAARAASPAATSRLDYYYGGATFDAYAAQLSGSGALTFTRKQPGESFFEAVTWGHPKGQYDVRVRRTTVDSGDVKVADDVYWDVLQSTDTTTDPVTSPHIAVTGVRVKASDELSGYIDSLNGVPALIAPSLDPALVAGDSPDFSALTAASWSVVAETRNPADVCLAMMRGVAAANPPADSEIDWPAWGRFWRWCDQNGFAYDQYLEQGDMRRDALARQICAAGRARPVKYMGQWSVVIDGEREDGPVQMFTAANGRGFTASRSFPADVHAVRVNFPNAAQGYKADERVVYWDGYDASSATKIERLDLPGVTDEDTVWKLARFYLATAKGQTERYRVDVDIEHLTVRLGDLVLIAHHVLLVGLGQRRVTAVAKDELDRVTHVTLDAPVPMAEGGTYGVRWRAIEGSGASARIVVDDASLVVTVAGEQTTLAFASPIADGQPAEGDLVAFGEFGKETIEALVKNIRKGPKFTAQLELVAYAKERFLADQGTVPAFQTGITEPFQPRPSTPVWRASVASADAIRVHFQMPATAAERLARFEARWRLSPDADEVVAWTALPPLKPDARVAVLPPGERGESYDVEIVAVDVLERRSTALVVSGVPAQQSVDAPDSCAVAAVEKHADNGAVFPAFEVEAAPDESPQVEHLVVEIRPGASTSDDDWRVAAVVPASLAKGEITGVIPGASYDFAFSFRARRDVSSARTLVPDVTAANVFRAAEAVGAAPGGALDVALAAAGTAAADALLAAQQAQADLATAEGVLEGRLDVLEASEVGNLLEDPELEAGDVTLWRASAGLTVGLDDTGDPRALVVAGDAAEAGEAGVVTWPGAYAVSEGGLIDASAEVALAGYASAVAVRAVWLDAAGDVLQADVLGSGGAGRVGGLAAAPAGAAAVTIETSVTASAAGAWTLRQSEPMVARGVDGQSASAPYADPGSPVVAAVKRAVAAIGNLAARLDVTSLSAAEGEASVKRLEQVVGDGQSLIAQAISEVRAELAGVGASVLTESAARSDADGALASLISALEAFVGDDDAGGTLVSRVVAAADAIITLEGYARARWNVSTSVPGADAFISAYAENAQGEAYSSVGIGGDIIALYNSLAGTWTKVLELVGGAAHFSGPVYVGGVSIVIDPDLPGLTVTAGATSLAIGAGIGQGGAYLMWCGPSSIADADRTSASAVFSIGTDGSAYFGGGLTAGALETKNYSSATAAGSEAEIGPFATLGGPIVVVWGGSLQHSGKRLGNQSYSGSPEVTLKLWRKEGAGSKTLVGTQTFSLTMTSFFYEGETDETYFQSHGSSSATYTDSAGGTAERTYWVEFDDYSLFTIPGTPGTDFFYPSYGATCVED